MKEMICIICPHGCHLTVSENGEIHGNFCPRGITYGKQELTHPMRTLTTTVALKSQSGLLRLPVRSEQDIPKEKLMEVMEILQKIEVKAPISMHQVIVENVLNLGINIIATREVKE